MALIGRRFRLETLLRVRRAREDERKRTVAARLRAIEALRQKRAELEVQLRAQTDALRAALTGENADVNFLRWGRHWLGRLQAGIRQVDAEAAQHGAMLAHERAALAHARKETKVLERLKERQLEAWAAEEGRRQQGDLDDMNGMRFVYGSQARDAAT
jgi:flagellar export protein FliJ